MRRTRKAAAWAATAVMAAALAACSQASAAPAAPTIPTVAQAAAQMGATDVQPYGPAVIASAYAHAQYKGHRVTIATFATPQLETEWVSMAGIAATVVAEGSLYAAVEIRGQ